jgi:hypothetical protein
MDVMFGLIKLNNIGENISIKEKIKSGYEVIGVYDSVIDIEKAHLNYFAHKYRLSGNFWCYFSRKQNDWNKDIDSHKLSDMVIIDLDNMQESIFDYQTGKHFNKEDNFLKEVLREIKLSMIL